VPTAQIEFPILKGPILTSKDESNFARKTAGIRQEIVDRIRSINPYKGGDNTLWRLHELNRIDKHNMLIATLGAVTAVNGLPAIDVQWNGDRWDGIPGVPLGLKQGDKFTPHVPGSEVNKNTGFFVEVVFNEAGVAEGYPVVLALREFHRRVERICGEFSVYLK
jgi:hypothetical protein